MYNGLEEMMFDQGMMGSNLLDCYERHKLTNCLPTAVYSRKTWQNTDHVIAVFTVHIGYWLGNLACYVNLVQVAALH